MLFPFDSSFFTMRLPVERPAKPLAVLFLAAGFLPPGVSAFFVSPKSFLVPELSLLNVEGSAFVFLATGFLVVELLDENGHLSQLESLLFVLLAVDLALGFALGFSSLANGLSLDHESPSAAARFPASAKATAANATQRRDTFTTNTPLFAV